MIRLVLTALLLAVTCAAGATAQCEAERVRTLGARIAAEAGERAQAYQTAPGAPADAPVAGDDFMTDLSDFALAARTLSEHIEATGGPSDLRCIFRGMSGDVTDRVAALDAAQTRADMSRAYAEIARLADQGARLAAEPELASDGPSGCEAG